jgi:hypothetical protein
VSGSQVAANAEGVTQQILEEEELLALELKWLEQVLVMVLESG